MWLPPHPPSLLWILTRDGRLASCEVSFVPAGVELRLREHGSVVWSRVFRTSVEAIEAADAERNRLIDDGWVELRRRPPASTSTDEH